MKIKKLLVLLVFILILATVISSVKLEQKRSNFEEEYFSIKERHERYQFLDDTVKLYGPFILLGLALFVYTIFNIWEFLLFDNLDKSLFRTILIIIFYVAVIVEVFISYKVLLDVRRTVMYRFEISSWSILAKPYLIIFICLILSKLLRVSIKEESNKIDINSEQTDFQKKWNEFNEIMKKDNNKNI